MMKNTYIATFYSHFGAIRYERMLRKNGIRGQLMPVPRSLSSSCGTCVRFEAESWDTIEPQEETEQIVQEKENEYICVYQS